MVQKGLHEDVAVRLGEYLLNPTDRDTDTEDVLKMLKSDPLLSKHEDLQQGVQEVELLLRYLKAYRAAEYVQLDLSLARGLDYYTGLIYEVVLDPDLIAREGRRKTLSSDFSRSGEPFYNSMKVVPHWASQQLPEEALSVGSIAAGGRYDDLVGKFSNRDIPCVGISFGIDRILTILKAIEAAKPNDAADSDTDAKPRVDVWIVIASSNPLLVEERMAIARDIRGRSRVSVDFDAKADKKPRKQMDVAEKNAKYVLYLEEDDESPGEVRIKTLDPAERDFDNDNVIHRTDVASWYQYCD
jgi:histidyl-tRNA synthetase